MHSCAAQCSLLLASPDMSADISPRHERVLMSTFQKSADEIRRAIIRELKAGTDVGELLVAGVVAAQNQVIAAAEKAVDNWDDGGIRGRGGFVVDSITDNRPGSWEASLVDQIIDAGGGRR